jgi:hypothetical protein
MRFSNEFYEYIEDSLWQTFKSSFSKIPREVFEYMAGVHLVDISEAREDRCSVFEHRS